MCRDSGFDGFLPKPADRDAIAAELDRLAGAGLRKAATELTPLFAAAGGALSGQQGTPLASAEKAPVGPPGAAEAGLAGGEFVGGLDFDTPRPF